MRSISWASRVREFSPPAPKEKDKDVGGGRRKASGWADRALIRTWVRRRPQYAVDERGGDFSTAGSVGPRRGARSRQAIRGPVMG